MTIEEFTKVAAVIRSAYPKDNILTTKEAVDVWYMLLDDLSYDAAQAAVVKHISNNRFAPSIAEIRELATEVVEGAIPDWGEGWGQLQRAIGKYGYYNQEKAMESLDELTRDVVNRLGFRALCLSENQEVDRANFRTIYLELAKRKKADAQTPMAIREKIATLTANNTNLIDSAE